MDGHPQKEYMLKAIEKAEKSTPLNQYAIGAIIVSANNEIIAASYTSTHKNNDATAHAEINAIREACSKSNDRYLIGCWLYSTLEPCPMCTSAAIWAKMKGIVWGASKEDAQEIARDSKDRKFTWRQIDISSKEIIDKGEPKIELVENFMKEKCKELFVLGENNK
jgi:tRNA(Arg) A34 adenosine deaminase TadA